jgi:hypothetical protein
MRKSDGKSQAAENMDNKNCADLLTGNIQKGYLLSVMQKSKVQIKPLQKVALVPTDEENEILAAGMRKHGLKKAVDVVRMALRQYAKNEELKFRAS